MHSVSPSAAGPPSHTVALLNFTRGRDLGTHIGVADNAVSRAVGLLGKSGLDSGGGLLIDPSSGIHTFGMRFPIDVIALDRSLRVCGLWPALPPWRIAGVGWKTRCILELPVGVIEESGTRTGDLLVLRQ
jgi:uncharacterized protein